MPFTPASDQRLDNLHNLKLDLGDKYDQTIGFYIPIPKQPGQAKRDARLDSPPFAMNPVPEHITHPA